MHDVTLFDFSIWRLLEAILSLAAAYVLALPLGWERGVKSYAAIGFRTFPIVSVGACAYLLLSRHLHEIGIYDADGLARVLRALMTGIGFIGGGAIVKRTRKGEGVSGVATGASIWTTGAIGACVAHGYYQIAVALCLTSLFVLDVSPRLARRVRRWTSSHS